MFEGLAVATSVACAVLFVLEVRQPPTAYRTTSKTASTACLALFALQTNGATPLALSLGLSALGDYFLAITDTNTNFLRGLSSFLLAHLLYVKILCSKSAGVELLLSSSSRQAILLVMAVVAPGLNYIMFARVASGLRVPVMVYSIAISAMFVSSLCVEKQSVTSGALLFTLSDSFLAIDRFVLPRDSKHATWMQYAVWILYYMGQLLLTLSLSGRI